MHYKGLLRHLLNVAIDNNPIDITNLLQIYYCFITKKAIWQQSRLNLVYILHSNTPRDFAL
jgi:hypothetical protein